MSPAIEREVKENSMNLSPETAVYLVMFAAVRRTTVLDWLVKYSAEPCYTARADALEALRELHAARVRSVDEELAQSRS
jgi:hypothetical protein